MYIVDSVSAVSGNVFSYNVINTGEGLAPGQQLDGGSEGACQFPITVDTSVDFCNSSQSQCVDNITGCKNGAVRSLTATAPGQIAISQDDLSFGLTTFMNSSICLIVEDCLKLSGDPCTSSDIVTVTESSADAFTTRFNEVSSTGGIVVVQVRDILLHVCLLYTSPSPRDLSTSRMPSSA